jgi:uncharacterized protein YlxP (DUF503 family)
VVVAVGFYEFHLPGCRSLKEKRSFLRPLKTRLRGEFEISAAEVAHQDLLQRASLGIAAVGPGPEALEPLLQRIRGFIEAYAEEHGAEIADERHEFVGFGDVGAPGSSFGAGTFG